MADQSPPTAPSLSRLAIDRSVVAPRRGRPFWKRWWFWAIALVVLAAVALFIGRRNAPQAVEIATVAAAYPSVSVSALNATGRVVAARRASVSSKGTGRLEWLGVQEGQRVTEGDIIARLENRDVAAGREQAAAQVQVARANLAQGQAELEDAEAAYKRAQDLAQQKFIAGSALDTAEARYNKQRAAIDTLRAQIAVAQANYRAADVAYDQTLIRAPFDGMVLTKSANVGDIVTPFSSARGTQGRGGDDGRHGHARSRGRRFRSDRLPRSRSASRPRFSSTRCPTCGLLGEVSRIVPTVDRSKATVMVKVKFVERDRARAARHEREGRFPVAPLKSDERTPLAALRPDAIVKRDGKDVVFVRRQGRSGRADAGDAWREGRRPGAR